MARLNRTSQAAGQEAQVALAHPESSVGVGEFAGRRYGARLPYADETLTTAELGAIVCHRAKHPGKAAWQWLKAHKVPTRTKGRDLLISGASVLAALNDAEIARRQRSKLRRAS